MLQEKQIRNAVEDTHLSLLEKLRPGPTQKLSRKEANMQQQEKSWNANYEVIDKLLCQERKEDVDHGTLYCGLAN